MPLRIEIGPRDIESGQALTMRRDTLEKAMPLNAIADAVSARLCRYSGICLQERRTIFIIISVTLRILTL